MNKAVSARDVLSPDGGIDGRTVWYVSAMERLVEVVQDLSQARALDTIMTIVRKAARELTGADGASFVLRDGDQCYYADENAIAPLWKGQRFPMKSCVSGWVMQNAVPAVIEDIYADPRVPADAYRPTFVKSLAMVPIRKDRPVGAIGNYWARRRLPGADELAILEALANVTSVALENVDLYGQLQQKIKALEESNYELSRFAWIASHDLKSPLRAIDRLSQWIEEDQGKAFTGESRDHFRLLRQRVRRMEKLLDDILEYSHVERRSDAQVGDIVDGRTVLADINALIDLPEGFVLKASESFGNVRLYRMPVERVFCNLVSNAIKHHDRPAGLIELDVWEESSRYIFTVRDDGPGVPVQYHRQIFEMFQTLKPRDAKEGSGMGLALVKKIVMVYGGDVAIESGEGRGAVFRFTWPKVLEGKKLDHEQR